MCGNGKIIKKNIKRFWETDFDLAGEEATNRIIESVMYDKEPVVHDSVGDAEFPYDDVIIRLAAIATIIATSLQVVSTLSPDECRLQNITNIVLKIEMQLAEEKKPILQDREFYNFVKNIIAEHAKNY